MDAEHRTLLRTIRDASFFSIAFTFSLFPSFLSSFLSLLDYVAMDAEHRTLLRTIRDAGSDARAEPKDKLTLTIAVVDDVVATTRKLGAQKWDRDADGERISSGRGPERDDDFARSDGDADLYVTAAVRVTVANAGAAAATNVALTISTCDAVSTKQVRTTPCDAISC
jgi:hypothetical protein